MISKIKRGLGIILSIMMMLSIIPNNFVRVEATTGTTYYLDSINGDDNSSGTNENSAWKNLSKIKDMVFEAGDKILLKSGSIWNNQQLKLNGSGSEGQPVIVDKYGEGNDPIINVNGEEDYGLYLLNGEYWEIGNLEITNKGTEEKRGRTGVMIEAQNIGVLNHIYLKNLNVHDVNGDSFKKDMNNGGIFFVVNDDTKVENPTISKFNDILVEGCTVKDVNRSGISVGGSPWDYKFNGHGGYFPQELIDTTTHTNVLIRNNYVEASGGDAIVLEYCNKPLVEYNIANGCNTTSGANSQYSAGIWPWRCVDAVFQFNEVYGTKYNGDGMAYDCDYGLRTVYQYNYSHDNEGGFMLMCQDESLDSIVRYNISQNDRDGALSISGKASGQIYNNVIYTDVNSKPFRYDWGTGDVGIYNNVFYNGGAEMSGNWLRTAKYSNNAYYGYKGSDPNPLDKNKVVLDPLFVEAGTGEYGIDSLNGYMLQENSPLINAGMNIKNNGGRDYYGNPINDGRTDIGAFEADSKTSIIPEGLTVIDDKDIGIGLNNIEYEGTWVESQNEIGFYKNTSHWSDTPGSKATVRFKGTKFYILGVTNLNHGTYNVSIDGAEPITVDNYASDGFNTQQIVYESEDLEYGEHKVEIILNGNNPHGGGYGAYLDAICVLENENGIIEIDNKEINVNEDEGLAEVKVKRTGGSKGKATVAFNVSSVTAIKDKDFEGVVQDVIFEDGQTEAKASVALIDNDEIDESRYFNIEIESVVGAIAGFKKTAKVNIIDDEIVKIKGVTASSEESSTPAISMIDNNINTLWHTKWSGSNAPKSDHWVILELENESEINTLRYIPRQDRSVNGTIVEYKLHTSVDGIDYTQIEQGTLEANKDSKYIQFKPTKAKYVKFEVINTMSDAAGEEGHFASAAEMNLFKMKIAVDKSQLKQSIENAIEIANSSVVGPEEGQYPELAKNNLLEAILKAEEILNDTSVTQEIVEDAIVTLNRAVEVFENSVNIGKVIVSKIRNLSLRSITENSAAITWREPEHVRGLVEYVIYKDGKELASVPVGTTEYEATELRVNTIYGFKVVAKYSNGEKSKPVSVNLRTKKA